jgi:hypothetical protein
MSVRHVPAQLLGVLVGGLLLLTNARELAIWAELGPVRWVGYAAIVATVVAMAIPALPGRRSAAASIVAET